MGPLSQFRDLINRPLIHANLWRNQQRFLAVCGAMDLLGDADEAFEKFLRCQEGTARASYLELYGVYQAIQLTVDAVRKLGRVFGRKSIQKAALDSLAIERRFLFGHPIDHGEDGDNVTTFVSRFESGKKRITAQHVSAQGKKTIRAEYSPVEAVRQTRTTRDSALLELIQHIVQDDLDRRRELPVNCMSKCFHQSTEWMLQCFDVAAHSSAERNMLICTHAEILIEQIEDLENLLKIPFLEGAYPGILEASNDAKQLLLQAARGVNEDPNEKYKVMAFTRAASAAVRKLMADARDIDNGLFEDFRASA
jgi:hypothetical protein